MAQASEDITIKADDFFVKTVPIYEEMAKRLMDLATMPVTIAGITMKNGIYKKALRKDLKNIFLSGLEVAIDIEFNKLDKQNIAD